jgi:hypothetical protein
MSQIFGKSDAHSDAQPSHTTIVIDAIKLIRKVRDHIGTDNCKCCRDALREV